MLSAFPHAVHDSQAVFRAVLKILSYPAQTCRLPVLPDVPHEALSPALAALALSLCDSETPLWLSPSLREKNIISWLRFHRGIRFVEHPAEALFALVASPEELPPLSAFQQGIPAYPDRSTTIFLGGIAFGDGKSDELRQNTQCCCGKNLSSDRPGTPCRNEGCCESSSSTDRNTAGCCESFLESGGPERRESCCAVREESGCIDRAETGCRIIALEANGPGIKGKKRLPCRLPEDLLRQWQENTRKFPLGVDLLLCGSGCVAGLPRTTRLKPLAGEKI